MLCASVQWLRYRVHLAVSVAGCYHGPTFCAVAEPIREQAPTLQSCRHTHMRGQCLVCPYWCALMFALVCSHVCMHCAAVCFHMSYCAVAEPIREQVGILWYHYSVHSRLPHACKSDTRTSSTKADHLLTALAVSCRLNPTSMTRLFVSDICMLN